MDTALEVVLGRMCDVSGCDRVRHSHGLCQTHLDRQRRGLDLVPLPPLRKARRATALAEDVEWLAGTDSPESIAHRMGYGEWESLRKALHRIGRDDLIAAVLDRRELSPWAAAS